MSPQDCKDTAATARVARVATIDPDGTPNLVPLVFALEGDTIFSVVDAKPKRSIRLQRLANVRRDPRVTVLFDHYDEDWSHLWWVKARGVARVTEDVEDVMARLRSKYAQYETVAAEEIGLIIDVQRWSGWRANASG